MLISTASGARFPGGGNALNHRRGMMKSGAPRHFSANHAARDSTERRHFTPAEFCVAEIPPHQSKGSPMPEYFVAEVEDGHFSFSIEADTPEIAANLYIEDCDLFGNPDKNFVTVFVGIPGPYKPVSFFAPKLDIIIEWIECAIDDVHGLGAQEHYLFSKEKKKALEPKLKEFFDKEFPPVTSRKIVKTIAVTINREDFEK
ncbi:hypothetical protein VF04_36545, partial [Nostoc linckia z7]